MKNKDLKHNAKISLKGKYGESIILTIVYSLIIFSTNFISSFIYKLFVKGEPNELFATIIQIIITSLFYFGQLSFYLKISRDEKVSWTELFKNTNMFWGYLCISFFTFLFTYLWSLLFIIPGIIAVYRYQLAYYIKLDAPNMGSLDAIRESKELMHGNKFKFFVLQLSFLGWTIIGILTLGIGFLWINPYIQVTFANFYNSLLPEKNPSILLNKRPKSNFIFENRNQIPNNNSNNINNQNNNNNSNITTNELPSWNIGNINTNINNIQNTNNNNSQ